MGGRVAVPDLPSFIHPIISATAGFRTCFLPSQLADPRARRLGCPVCVLGIRGWVGGNPVSGWPAGLVVRMLSFLADSFFTFSRFARRGGAHRVCYFIETLNTSNALAGFENSLTSHLMFQSARLPPGATRRGEPRESRAFIPERLLRIARRMGVCG